MELPDSPYKIKIIESMLLAIDDLFPTSEKGNEEICNKYILHALFILKHAFENKVSVDKTVKVHYKAKLHYANNKEVEDLLRLNRNLGNYKRILFDE